MAGKLTNRQQRFVDEYLVDLNATQAAIRAGYSEKTAAVIACENLNKPNIAAEIQARRAALSEKLEITQERVLQELAAIGFARLPDYVAVETEQTEKLGIHPITGEVTLLPAGWCQYVKVIDTADLPDIKRAAIASIKQGRNGVEVKFHDKVRALEMLGKHLGLFDGKDAPAEAHNNLFEAIMDGAWEDVGTDDIPEIEQEAVAGDDMVEPPDLSEP